MVIHMNMLKLSLTGGVAILALAACSPSGKNNTPEHASTDAAPAAKAPEAKPAANAAAATADAAKEAASNAVKEAKATGAAMAEKTASAASDVADKTAAASAAAMSAAKAAIKTAAAGNGTGGDAAAGKLVFNKCHVCHTVIKGKMKVGPSLFGVVGRTPGTLAGYKYSPAMIAFGQGGAVWDEATLNTYLRGPQALVPKIKMFFPGLKDEKDRRDVIAYLKSVSG